MDRDAVRHKVQNFVLKYKYVALILVLGMVLMLLPESGAEPTAEPLPAATEQALDLQEQLEHILAQMDGVGKVEVLLTQYRGRETVYQTDEDSSAASDSESLRVETVIVTDSQRTEAGLIRQINPPVYLGAVIVCQGADRPSVQLGVVEAVSGITGISTDRITVLKMK